MASAGPQREFIHIPEIVYELNEDNEPLSFSMRKYAAPPSPPTLPTGQKANGLFGTHILLKNKKEKEISSIK